MFKQYSTTKTHTPTQKHVPVYIAPLWRLLCAGLIDGAILATLAGFIYWAHLWLYAPENLHLIHGTGIIDSYRSQALLCSLVIISLMGSIYSSLCALNHGQTLGRMVMDIVLIPENSQGINLKRAFGRSLLAPLSLICLGAGYFWAIVDAKSRTWHDLAYGTVAVYRKVSIPKH